MKPCFNLAKPSFLDAVQEYPSSFVGISILWISTQVSSIPFNASLGDLNKSEYAEIVLAHYGSSLPYLCCQYSIRSLLRQISGRMLQYRACLDNDVDNRGDGILRLN